MPDYFKEHFKFENAGLMFQASFQHTKRHVEILTMDDRSIFDVIRFYSAWRGAAHITI